MHGRLRRTTAWIVVFALVVILPLPVSARVGKSVASEFLEQSIEEDMASADILRLLAATVGATASADTPPTTQQLREGLFVTALPQGPLVLLRVEVTREETGEREAITEVALSAELGRTFVTLVEAALTTAEAIFASQHFAAPWELQLHAESLSGGEAVVKVAGDAEAHFTLGWEFASPQRPIDRFRVPTAFAHGKGGQEHLTATVHFPTTLETFVQFVDRAYGRGPTERFTDFPLSPHRWLLLTVTAQDATNRVVDVHFDALTLRGERLFVAEAPASTSVGGRFVEQTVTRMQEMLREEATQPGSSRKWQTEFYYADPQTGVVVVVVQGERGLFDIAYHLETSIQQVQAR
jgi:hypothetical protein